MLFIGSMLPDIIDKPLGMWLFSDEFSNGRIFSHTLLFVLLLTAVGIYLYNRRSYLGVLVLAAGSLAHLILDGMWLTPKTLFWPVFGLGFEHHVYENWLGNIVHTLATNPGVYIPEIIGGLLLAVFFWDIIRRGRMTALIRSGHVS
ncbi:hypothetical protein DGWBC_0904 [Dehalogenimonas sp. WBC-2]|nr:hypothetical protein DGWBC_0904 [Dehalogenimonas sp. WBC-2]